MFGKIYSIYRKGYVTSVSEKRNDTNRKDSNDLQRDAKQGYGFLDALQDCCRILETAMEKYSVVRYATSITVLYLEFKFLVSCFANALSRIFIIVNCYTAPERVVLDYIHTLF